MATTSESHRRLPFLKRNFARAIHSLTNGTFGSPKETMASGLDFNDDGPRKRPRLSQDSNIDHLSAPQKASDYLRIEVLRIRLRDPSKDLPDSPGTLTQGVTLKARCRITISESSFKPRVLHCDSQPCDVIPLRRPDCYTYTVRIHLSHPFMVPRDSLLIHSPADGSYDLSDSYTLSVELESSEHNVSWPPLEGRQKSSDSEFFKPHQEPELSHYWTLTSRFNQISGLLTEGMTYQVPCSPSSNAPRPIDYNLYQPVELSSDYNMEVDLRWSSGFIMRQRPKRVSQPCITGLDLGSERATQCGNGVNNEFFNSVNSTREQDGLDTIAGLGTPTRTLRSRKADKTYNLKSLSDQVHGTQRRRRKPTTQDAVRGDRVRYFLPPGLPVSLDGFCCLACGSFCQSLNRLQFHLKTLHPDHDYKLIMTGQEPQFHVTACSPSQEPKEFYIERPVKQLDLDTFTGSDSDWILHRMGLGMRPNDTATNTIAIKTEAIKEEPELCAQHTEVSKIAQKAPETPRITIQDSRRVYYHPHSRKALKLGDEVPAPKGELGWFRHKHRGDLNEHDLTPAEAEYIKEFDSMLGDRDIPARRYFPRAWLNFVRQRAGWLVAAKHRMLEFTLHESYLIASKLLQDEHIREAAGLIEEARRTTQVEEEPQPPSRIPPIRKSAKGCGVCHFPVLCGPRLIMCNNEDCKHRLYHTDCLHDSPRGREKDLWLCKPCVEAKKSP